MWWVALSCLVAVMFILKPSHIPFWLKEKYMISPQVEGVVLIQHGRWFVGGRIRNVCYWDGTVWHQAPRSALCDTDELVRWLERIQIPKESSPWPPPVVR